MKRIPLTKGAFTIIDDEDFDFVSQWRWKLHPQGYACRSTWIDGKCATLLLHRVIANTPPDLQTDHINRDQLDNRRANLRNVTGSVNTMNQGLHPRNKSGHRGVSWDSSRQKWIANTKPLGRYVHLGRFDRIEDAITAREAYDKAVGRAA